MEIPNIIHQIWDSGIKNLPVPLAKMCKTWREHHPDWVYEFWDTNRINKFIQKEYPQYWNTFCAFTYNIQRWDAIRYLILHSMGGMYVDVDYECLEPFEDILQGKMCCFSAEPEEHVKAFDKKVYFNNALMASIPSHPFIGEIIASVFGHSVPQKNYPNKMMEVLETTGPLMLSTLYEKSTNKENVYIIPADVVSPLSKFDIQKYVSGNSSDEYANHLEQKLIKAIGIHYFLGTWLN